MGSASTPVVATVSTGLSPNAKYVYRVIAENADGTSTGTPDKEFATLPNAPTVTTTAGATSIAQTTATVAGTVNPNGGNVTACKVEYGLTTGYGSEASCASLPGAGNSPVAVEKALSGLEANKTYHFRFVATNAGGTGQGSDQTFSTLPNAPTVTTISPTKGPLTAGTVITITGTNLSGATSVKFGSSTVNPPPPLIENTATTIKFTAPSCSAGVQDIRVVTAGGESANTAADDYTCVTAPAITSISPTKGPLTAGTAIEITGTNLGNADSDKFGSSTGN